MSATSNLTMGLMVLLVISGVLGLANLGVKEYESTSTFGDGANLLDNYGSNLTLNQFGSDDLPESEDSVSVETGNIFTDIFKTAKSWILNTKGAKYVLGILGAPIVMLNSMGLDPFIVWTIGAMWYGLFAFLIASWVLNR